MAGTFVNVSRSANVKTAASLKPNGTSSGSANVDIKAGTEANRTSNTSGYVKRVTTKTGGSGQLPPLKQNTGGSGKMPPPSDEKSNTAGSPAAASASLSITGCTSGLWVLLLSLANLWQWKAQAHSWGSDLLASLIASYLLIMVSVVWVYVLESQLYPSVILPSFFVSGFWSRNHAQRKIHFSLSLVIVPGVVTGFA
jgi:hypothetical protein